MSDLEARCRALEIRVKYKREAYERRVNNVSEIQTSLARMRRSIAKRKKVAENRKSMIETGISVETLTEIVNCLREQLLDVHKEIEEHTKQLSLSDIPTSSLDETRENIEHLRKVNRKALLKKTALNRQINELRCAIAELQEKDEELIGKQSELREALSSPLDDLRIDEVLTENAEAEVRIIQKRLDSIQDIVIDHEYRRVVRIEQANRDRKARIKLYRDAVNDLKTPPSQTSTSESRRWKERANTCLSLTDAVISKTEDIADKLDDLRDKHDTLFATENQIKIVSKETKKLMKRNQRELMKKVEMATSLQAKVNYIEKLQSQVDTVKQENDLLEFAMTRLADRKCEIFSINKRIAKGLRMAESRREDNERLVFALKVKKEALEKRREQTDRRRNILKAKNIEIVDILNNRETLEHQVVELEEEVREIEQQLQSKNAEVNRLLMERDQLLNVCM